MIQTAEKNAEIEHAIERLKSHREGDEGLQEVVALGPVTIPALKKYVFARNPSGLYEARRRAVIALQILHADETLIEFLQIQRHIDDPIERTGEEAIINAAARGLMRSKRPEVFPLLQTIATRQPSLAGVIEALGSFESIEALPQFLDALLEDFSRNEAENAIRRLGPVATDALMDLLEYPKPTAENESPSSLRRRRSALRLLTELAKDPQIVTSIAPFMNNKDDAISVYASELVFALSPAREQALDRLLELLPVVDDNLSSEISRCLGGAPDFVRARVLTARKEWAAVEEDTLRKYIALRRFEAVLKPNRDNSAPGPWA
jgi:hypothetical protein